MRTRLINGLKAITNNLFTKRTFASDHQKCVSLVYEDHGDPVKQLEMVESFLESPKKDEVLIKMLVSPINPADINVIQGVYPLKPKLPAIGGSEGVGEVMEIGSNVKDFKQGDWVIPAMAGLGTWRSHIVCASNCLLPISKELSLIHAATFAINPCTAYRMLKDFTKLQEGDVVIQNAANSAVGQAVIQIAKAMGLRTINIVRGRPSIGDLVKKLEELGATHVVTDEFARSSDMGLLFKKCPKAKLGLNAVGGKAVVDVVKCLADGSDLVTYGGMSKLPILISTGAFIFKNIHCHGYWMTRWTEQNHGSVAQKDMFDYLSQLMLHDKLKPPRHEMRMVADYKEAMASSMQGYTTTKQLLNFGGCGGGGGGGGGSSGGSIGGSGDKE